MPFDKQPYLKGDLLTLRPLLKGDLNELYAVASDPLIWEQHPNSDRYRREVFGQFFQDALASGGALTAIDNANGMIVGSSRFHAYDEERREIEIGWTFLARSHWGGTYNREMKRLMLDHAFRTVDNVVFLIGPANMRSRRAIEKLGARAIGTRLSSTGIESVVYSILRQDWGLAGERESLT